LGNFESIANPNNPISARPLKFICDRQESSREFGQTDQQPFLHKPHGINIPEDIALLSASDDLLCEASPISISSVRSAGERIGYEAAEMLDLFMSGKVVKERVKLIPPLKIITRQSTDALAIKDPVLVKALKYIRENAGQLIKIDDICRHAGVSRRLLERHFQNGMQRTPAAEIRRVHLERAKLLLAETDKPIPDISDASGFGSPEYMAQIFRLELDTTPLKYRRDVRCR